MLNIKLLTFLVILQWE